MNLNKILTITNRKLVKKVHPDFFQSEIHKKSVNAHSLATLNAIIDSFSDLKAVDTAIQFHVCGIEDVIDHVLACDINKRLVYSGQYVHSNLLVPPLVAKRFGCEEQARLSKIYLISALLKLNERAGIEADEESLKVLFEAVREIYPQAQPTCHNAGHQTTATDSSTERGDKQLLFAMSLKQDLLKKSSLKQRKFN